MNEKIKLNKLAVLVMILGEIMLLVMLFLPYGTAKNEYKKSLMKLPDEMYIKEIGMKYSDVVNVSLVEYVKIYREAINENVQKESCIVTIVVIALFAIFSVIALLLAICKKPVGVIVFNILGMIAFYAIHFDFKDRDIIGNSKYGFGAAYPLGYIFGVVVMVGAIMLLVVRKREQK